MGTDWTSFHDQTLG